MVQAAQEALAFGAPSCSFWVRVFGQINPENRPIVVRSDYLAAPTPETGSKNTQTPPMRKKCSTLVQQPSEHNTMRHTTTPTTLEELDTWIDSTEQWLFDHIDEDLRQTTRTTLFNNLAGELIRHERGALFARIVPHIDILCGNGELFLGCVQHHITNTECLEIMLQQDLDPDLVEFALVRAVKNTNLNAVKVLAKHAEQTALNNALCHSVDMPHMNDGAQQVFLYLITVADARDDGSWALQRALIYNNDFAVEQLEQISDIDAAIENQELFPAHPTALNAMLQRRALLHALNEAVGSCGTASKRSKM